MPLYTLRSDELTKALNIKIDAADVANVLKAWVNEYNRNCSSDKSQIRGEIHIDRAEDGVLVVLKGDDYAPIFNYKGTIIQQVLWSDHITTINTTGIKEIKHINYMEYLKWDSPIKKGDKSNQTTVFGSFGDSLHLVEIPAKLRAIFPCPDKLLRPVVSVETQGVATLLDVLDELCEAHFV